MSKTIIISLVAFVVVFVIVLNLNFTTQDREGEGNQMVCTRDTKVCPDATVVTRIGPKCEFANCPNGTTNIFNVKAKIGEKVKAIPNREIYISPLELISDSRCSKDVQCIWAGTVVVKVRFEDMYPGTYCKKFELDLELNKSVTFCMVEIYFTNALPEKTREESKPNQYIFKVDASSEQKVTY